ncbi:hypothetical protein RvY_03808 [Ramazzottius varieornatus]|uniref:G-protein coupled receptors family 1 profile domain-containing protein n=1 Tax=Ramazzottius varieornatus TaxID=947166 RepID=A0A1D1UST2_RAMVA|nr:hypothetical protein RvY_03808 [Ramazzottius varieornatus]
MDLDFKSLAQMIQPDGELHFYDFLDLRPEHGAGMVVVALLSLISLSINVHLIFGRMRLRTLHPLTAFDGLVLSLLLTNFLLASLVIPFSMVAMVILENIWTFGRRYCLISAVLTYFLVFTACWTVPVLTIQFFYSYLLLAVPTCMPEFFRRSTGRWYHITGPAVILLILGAFYCPYAYSTVQLSAGSYPCLAIAETRYAHESIWYLFAPTAVTLLMLIVVYLVRSNTDTPFPRPVVEATNQEPTESAGQRFPSISLHVLGNGPSENISPPTEIRRTTDLVMEQAVKEAQWGHLKISLILTASLIVFVGPYAVVQFLHPSHDLAQLKAWRISYTWMSSKVFIEPLLIMASFRRYQQAFRFWKYRV